MKLLKKLFKKENGSITMTVLASMLFILTVLVASYFSISNQSSNQKKNVGQISKQYSVTDAELEEKYNKKLNELNNMTYIKIDEIKALGNLMIGKTTNTETMDKDGNKIIIPGGFKIVEEENVVTDKVENGFVIEDKNENQWVWIPVSSSDLANMYAEDATGWTMYGTNINTKYKTLGTTLDARIISRTDPGVITNNIFREPDIVCGEGLEYDGLEENWIAAGFTSLENMAIGLKTDYKNMIDSIKINGGFYIGRYELGINGSTKQVKKGTVMNEANWYNLYSNCKSFNTTNVESRMMWDCQYDQICRFIKEHGDKVDLDDSKLYGNYTNSEGNAAINRGSVNFNSTTGRNEAWKTNNIYDLAGNCWEFTQGAMYKTRRTRRGRKLCLY